VRVGIATALLAALVLDCGKQKTTSLCVTDADCGDPVNLYCDKASGYCLCKTDAACQSGEVCNEAGYCVPQSRCTTNADCPQGLYCETVSSTCAQIGRCELDIECPFGQICDVNSATCQPGCRSYGDCPKGQACICPLGDGGTTNCNCPVGNGAARETCPLATGPDGGLVTIPPGKCTSSQCGDTTFCQFGYTCQSPTSGGPPECVNTYDPKYRPYCDNCVNQPGQTPCGVPSNFCLIAFDPNTDIPYNFCGVDCSQGQSCPNGYSCQDVIIVLQRWQCSSNTDCSQPGVRSTLPCQHDSDCPNEALCAIDPGATTGFCAGQCETAEGTFQGFCSCVVDDDCFQDTCDSTTQTCSVSGEPCDPNVGCPGIIHCVDFGGGSQGGGGCLIGENCAPINGLTCSQVKP
jgi:hypothetical protein